MKYLLIVTLFLKLSTLVALAQQPVPSSLRTRITDDGQTLSIQFDGFKSNRKVHYDQHFDVSNMSGLQKEIINTPLGTDPPALVGPPRHAGGSAGRPARTLRLLGTNGGQTARQLAVCTECAETIAATGQTKTNVRLLFPGIPNHLLTQSSYAAQLF